VIDGDRPAHDRRIGAEAPLPESMREHGDRVAIDLAIVIVHQQPPESRPSAKTSK
jgi:hypothetical protein